MLRMTVIAAVASIATVTAMTEEMHSDEENEDQYPEPVFCQPFHDVSPLAFRALCV